METVRLATNAMGTRFEVIVNDACAGRARAAGEAALREVEHWHDRLSVFDRSSFLSYLNAHALTRAVELDAELFALFSVCERVWAATGGAFDPTIGGEMVRRGLHDRSAWGGVVGFDAVELTEDARTVRFRERVSLDLGGVAKGFALDRAADVLRDAEIGSAFIHGGTSSGVAIGGGVNGRGWGVAMGREADAPRVELRDAAYSVSSPTGRVVGGEHHIVEPSGSRDIPADQSAVVWGRGVELGGFDVSGAACDAWATALVVLGGRSVLLPIGLEGAHRMNDAWRIMSMRPCEMQNEPAVAGDV